MIFIISVIQIYFFPNRKLCQYDAKMVFDSEKKSAWKKKQPKTVLHIRLTSTTHGIHSVVSFTNWIHNLDPT